MTASVELAHDARRPGEAQAGPRSDVADLGTVAEVASRAEQERRILEGERKRLRLESRDAAQP